MSFKYFHYRSKKGQALAEGTAAMALLTFLAVGLVLLILGVGMAVLYQLKISYATMIAAKTAVDDSMWAGVPRPGYPAGLFDTDLKNTFLGTLQGMNIDTSTATLSPATPVTFSGKPFLKVTGTVSGLKILSGGILPSAIPISATVVVPASGAMGRPPMILGITVPISPSVTSCGAATCQGFYVPCYGGGNGPWGAINNSWGAGTDWAYAQFHISPGFGSMDSAAGPTWNWDGGPPFTTYTDAYH